MPFHERPLLFRKRPFGLALYDEFQISDRGTFIDERICLDLQIPIKNICYKKITIFPGQTTRIVGSVKITCQQVFGGKSGQSIQFSGKVIRNLAEMFGVEAVAGQKLSNKLSDLPVLKTPKPQKQVAKWLHDHYNLLVKDYEDESIQTAYPTGTQTSHSCDCDWSRVADNSFTATKCCEHQGLCRDCSDKLDDIEEDEHQEDVSENAPDDRDCQPENLHFLNALHGTYEDDYGPAGPYGDGDGLSCDQTSEDLDDASSSALDSDCGDPEHFLVAHCCHLNPTNNFNSAYEADHASYSDQEVVYDRQNDRFVSRAFADQAIKCGYDLASRSVDQTRNAFIVHQTFREAEDDELMQLALQHGYDDRTGAID